MSEDFVRRRAAVSYKESGMSDAAFEALLREEQDKANPQKRRKLTHNALAKGVGPKLNSHMEIETAWAVNFNALGISEEEENLLPPDASEPAYVQMRNYVLVLWRAEADRYLSEEEAMYSLRESMKPYARIAWRFLDTAGYINFGVAEAIRKRRTLPAQPRGSIIIVGAGLAGLAAAQGLQKEGFKVLVLEGHDRPGGRVYTKKLEGGRVEAVADLGGSIVTGMDGNPLSVLVKQLKIPMHDIEQTQVALYLDNGTTPPKSIDEKVEEDYNKILDQCSDFRDNIGEISDNISLETAMMEFWKERCEANKHASSSGNGTENEANGFSQQKEDELRHRLFMWHLANLEFANAASMKDLSVRTWDQDDPNELPGAHCFVPGSNLRLVKALSEGVDICYNAKVTGISYSQGGVKVKFGQYAVKGDAVLVTASLGVLKAGTIAFKPPLPERKVDAIKRVGFGLLNKLVMLFPYKFWGEDDMFGRLPALNEERGQFYLFYSYADISGGDVLTALVSGKAAQDFEAMSAEQATRTIMEKLADIFGAKGIEVPEPLQVCCTRWGQDELTRGSYSSMAVGALGGEDYDVLAESVGGRVFFAGEATTKTYPATMHGAFLSGLREAANIAATLARAEAKRKEAAEKAAAGQSASVRPLDADALEQAAAFNFLTKQLAKVFADTRHPLYVEFGSFSAVVGPPDSDWEQEAVLRVDIGAAKGRVSAKSIQILVIIPKTELFRLQDLPGGDEARIASLMSNPVLRIVGRSGISEFEAYFLCAILEHRKLEAPTFRFDSKTDDLGNGFVGRNAMNGHENPNPSLPHHRGLESASDAVADPSPAGAAGFMYPPLRPSSQGPVNIVQEY